ncbi:MAG: bifunctional [glutamine synthetase] adenylyltransferase/[glutamine synthetase]-adenylyl-L-tyrosine phosphorylase, partial [Alphaproteobacteria bacterium]
MTRDTGSIPLRHALKCGLEPLDLNAAESWLSDLSEAVKETEQAAEIAALLGHNDIAGFVGAVMQLSPFLRRLILEDTSRLPRLLDAAPDDSAASICDIVRSSWRDPRTTMAVLRNCRADLALLVAFADLGKVWNVDRAMAVLSSFADAAVEAAVNLSLAQEHSAGHIKLKDLDVPQKDCGWILLAVGKLGASELNYSSDIDLIALFDPESAIVPNDAEPGKIFVRLTQSLIRTLQEHTEDGYVLRTDLRLRPDPRSTAVAVSIPAALQYYESHGQNWERAALIKARPLAGDIQAGETFLNELAPFVWRRYLDYAAIADIHSIKRQIHEHRGHAEIAIAGHNLKLGRGGIREIEFFVQTQQLIAGGRNPNLRGRSTIEMLAELASEGWVDHETAEELAEAYRMLRTIEHRLQMVQDEQTHTLPDDPTELGRLARLSHFQTTDQLEEA